MVPSPPSTTTISVFFGTTGVLLPKLGRFDIVDDRHFEIGAPQLFDGFLDHRAAFTQTCMRHYHRMSGTDASQALSYNGRPMSSTDADYPPV